MYLMKFKRFIIVNFLSVMRLILSNFLISNLNLLRVLTKFPYKEKILSNREYIFRLTIYYQPSEFNITK